MAKHPTRNGRAYDVVAYPDGGWVFTPDEALIDDFNAEREANQEKIVETYNWLLNLGMSSTLGNEAAPVTGTGNFDDEVEHI